MNSKIGSTLCALALTVPAWAGLRAGEIVPAQKTGRVLVLDNERTLEGDIEQQGEQYRLRRSVGEVWIPGENVLRLCATREEAYLFLRSRANLRDPDEHLRLASWCHQHGLRKQTLVEVSAAVDLRPNHSESQRLLRSLQRSTETSATTPMPAHEDQESTPGLPAVNTESLSLYMARVQPILMNACANCHATGRGGSFKLVRTFENGSGNRKTTQQNLAAVLGQVMRDHPQSSPLLIKAVSVHGEMAQPALKSKDMPAYRILEEWVRVTIDSNPPLQESPLTPVAALQRTSAESTSAKPQQPPTEAIAGVQGTAVAPMVPSEPVKEADKSPDGPVDPYDPFIFNQQMHPKRKKAGGK
jgi:hypothetical protein